MSLPRVNQSKIEAYIRRLQELDAKQFHIICRMHLSFLIDLDSDKFDEILPPGEPICKHDGKSKRPGFGIKRKGSKESLLSCNVATSLNEDSVRQLQGLIEYLEKPENLKQEGLFRKSGNVNRQKELKEKLNNTETINFDNKEYNAHDCATTLKNCLGDLPEPLLTDRLYIAHCQVPDLISEDKKLKTVQILFLLMPKESATLLRRVLNLLYKVSVTDDNLMTADTLGTMFAPHLLCPRKITGTELQSVANKLMKVASFMIENAPVLFKIPTELGLDVWRYLKENGEGLNSPRPLSNSSCDDDLNTSRKRAKSTNDTEAVNTVISYADRPASQQLANTQCDTEVALAQLYAHVQSMPDSAKKKKLLKQFNRTGVGRAEPENRQKHKRSRSLGESLKKRFLKNHKRQISSHDSQIEAMMANQENISMELLEIFSPVHSPMSTPPTKRLYRKNMNGSPLAPVVHLSTSKPALRLTETSNINNTKGKTSTPQETFIESGKGSHKMTVPHIRRPLLDTPDTLKLHNYKEARFVSPITQAMNKASKQLQVQMNTPRCRNPMAVVQSQLESPV